MNNKDKDYLSKFERYAKVYGYKRLNAEFLKFTVTNRNIDKINRMINDWFNKNIDNDRNYYVTEIETFTRKLYQSRFDIVKRFFSRVGEVECRCAGSSPDEYYIGSVYEGSKKAIIIEEPIQLSIEIGSSIYISDNIILINVAGPFYLGYSSLEYKKINE